jgi:hypothetical protein
MPIPDLASVPVRLLFPQHLLFPDFSKHHPAPPLKNKKYSFSFSPLLTILGLPYPINSNVLKGLPVFTCLPFILPTMAVIIMQLT